MYGLAGYIGESLLKRNDNYEVEWLPFELKHTEGSSSVVYYPHNMTVKMFTDELKKVIQEERKSIIRIPNHFGKNPF